ncbi:pathogenicity island 1 protein SopD2, partial [Salmonella enterica subsp. enterica serovar Infantis]
MIPDIDEAIYRVLCYRFNVCFLKHKKQDVLEVLYTLIHGCEREYHA